MTKISATILAIGFIFQTHGSIDTLRHWNTSVVPIPYTTNATAYYARFDLPAPGYLKELGIWLGGSAGTCQITIFGHDGGGSLIEAINPLTPPKTITKSVSGNQRIKYILPDSVLMDNNQFFIRVTTLSSGTFLLSDGINRPPVCTEPIDGDFYYQYLLQSNMVVSDNQAFLIDAILNYPDLTPDNWLIDITNAKGLPLNLDTHNMSAADFDNDQDIDLLIGGKLYQNEGANDFKRLGNINNMQGQGFGNVFADFDNDGDLDMLILDAQDSSFIYYNKGTMVFTKTYVPSMPNFDNVSTVSVADANKDGYPDVFVGQYSDNFPEPDRNYLFYNDQSGGFTDESAKLVPLPWSNFEYPANPNKLTRASSWVDFDNDNDPDLYVGNYRLHPDEFYRNNGDGTFTDIRDVKGFDENNSGAHHTTGVFWTDYDNDGDMDALISRLAHPELLAMPVDHHPTAIYENSGPPSYNFTEHVLPDGIQYEETQTGGSVNDVNNDGLWDVYFNAFYSCRYSDLYLGQPNGSWKLESFDAGIYNLSTEQDAIWADITGDGRLDLVGGQDNLFRLYESHIPAPGNWTKIRLRSTSGNTYAIGAKVKVISGSHKLMQEVIAGHSQCIQRPYWLHFGLGNNGIADVVVQWPQNGQYESFPGVQVNTWNELIEGTGNPVGAEEVAALNWVLYPNPAAQMVTLECPTAPADDVTIRLFNSTGQMIGQHYYPVGEVDSKQQISLMDASGNYLVSGTYLIQIQLGDGTQFTKLLQVL